MLTKEEKEFLSYWDKNRARDKKFVRQLAYGLPRGLMFALPILVLVIFDDWYKNMMPVSKSQLLLIGLAVFGIAIFYSAMRMRFNWDYNEQLYKELKFKEKKELSSPN